MTASSLYKKIVLWYNFYDYPIDVLIKKFKKQLFVKKTKLDYSQITIPANLTLKYNYFKTRDLDISKINSLHFEYKINQYIAHYFDILGSGWCSMNFNAMVMGLEGNSYHNPIENPAKSAFCTESYSPIDWHRDIKTGHRFDANLDHLAVSKITPKGVDLKNSWELGRLQHLPQLALALLISPINKQKYTIEIINQIEDFIHANPCGMGIHWNCAMDVGIRAANLLFTFDLMSQNADELINSDFKTRFQNYIYQHGVFLYNNLEYKEGLTHNHYLCNIAGLLFISAYFNPSPEINDWLCFSIQQINAEMKRQFFDEGSNFEGSTSYHRLSSEVMVYCAALIVGLSDEKKNSALLHFPNQRAEEPWIHSFDQSNTNTFLDKTFLKKLFQSAIFSHRITKPNGEIVQIGDNDGGRFFILSPCGEMLNTDNAIQKYTNLKNFKQCSNSEQYWDESHVDHAPTISAINGFFNADLLSKYNHNFPLEHSLIQSIINKKTFAFELVQDLRHHKNTGFSPSNLKFSAQKTYPIPPIQKDSITSYLYSEFGIAIFKSPQFFLSCSFGTNPKSLHSWGHQHNDKLSLELHIGGKPVLIDPGTYLYASSPLKRIALRSTKSHNTIWIEGEEQNWWRSDYIGIYKLVRQSKCNIEFISETEIAISLSFRGIQQVRHIQISEEKIDIFDYSNHPFTSNWKLPQHYSNGYGKMLN